MIRVTVGVEAHTHEFIATAHEDQKFGFSLAGGDAAEAVRRVRRQSRACAGRPALAHRLADLRPVRVRGRGAPGGGAAGRRSSPTTRSSPTCIATLDLGGGLGIAYTPADDPPPPDAMAKSLTEIVARECQAAGLAVPRIAVEPGRAIVGPGHGDASTRSARSRT